MEVQKFSVVARPGFCLCKNNGAQGLAALHLRGLLFLLRRLGMKWATRLRRIVFCRDQRERAVIRHRDPGTDRNDNPCAPNGRFHYSRS